MAKPDNRDRAAAVLLAVICVLAFLIRFYRAGDPFGGYHSFNEGWYSTLALNYRTHSLLFPMSVFGTIDYNVVPFYSYILYAALLLFGDHEIVYRTATILFSVATIPLIYLIGRRFYGRAAGLAAAGVYAFAPASIVVGRNVQTDAVYICFLMASLHLYLKADDESRPALFLWAGLMFGFSFFTKQFAVLLLPALLVWEVVRPRGVRGLLDRGHALFVAGAAVVPAPFFLYHIITRAGMIVKSQAELSASQVHPLNIGDFRQVAGELYWALSPAVFVIFFLAAVAVLRGGRRRGDGLIVMSLLVFFVFFSIFHGHSYYLLYGFPFLALLCGRYVASFRRRAIAAAALALVLCVSAVQAVAFLCAVKYGYNEFATAKRLFENRNNVVLILDEDIRGSYRPPVQYYCRDVKVVLERDLAAAARRGNTPGVVKFAPDVETFIFSFLTRPVEQTPRVRLIIRRSVYTLVLFGWRITTVLSGEHYFSIQDIKFEKVASWKEFGVKFAGMDRSFMLSRPSPGSVVPVVDGKLRFDKISSNGSR